MFVYINERDKELKIEYSTEFKPLCFIATHFVENDRHNHPLRPEQYFKNSICSHLIFRETSLGWNHAISLDWEIMYLASVGNMQDITILGTGS